MLNKFLKFNKIEMHWKFSFFFPKDNSSFIEKLYEVYIWIKLYWYLNYSLFYRKAFTDNFDNYISENNSLNTIIGIKQNDIIKLKMSFNTFLYFTYIFLHTR